MKRAYLWPNWFLALGSALLLSGLVGCSGGSGDEENSTLIAPAAASLTDAFGELESSFEGQNPGTDVQVSFAGSSELLTQIQQGASADVFASEAKMNAAVEEGLVAEPGTFVRNRSVVIVPADNPAGSSKGERITPVGE